jgi:hypothetical protein
VQVWPAIPGPPEYRPDHVVRAFQALLHPAAEDWSDAGTMMRFAVGNDCGGSIYPAAVEATRVMLDLIAAYPGEPRTVALYVLLDWWAGFDPEPGYEQYDTAETGRVDLMSAMPRYRSQRAGGALAGRHRPARSPERPPGSPVVEVRPGGMGIRGRRRRFPSSSV